MDLSLQQNVRDLIAPKTLADVTNHSRNGDDGTVVPDPRLADSFLVNGINKDLKLGYRHKVAASSSSSSTKEGSRKRACRGEEGVRLDKLRKEALRMPGPGMWDGIL